MLFYRELGREDRRDRAVSPISNVDRAERVFTYSKNTTTLVLNSARGVENVSYETERERERVRIVRGAARKY